MDASPQVLKIAISVPLFRTFDYLPADKLASSFKPGCRVRVPFGNKSRIGVILDVNVTSKIPPSRLKPIEEILDIEPVLSESLLELLRWASIYYHHPIGEVVHAALPSHLRKGKPSLSQMESTWILNTDELNKHKKNLQRAHRQKEIVTLLQNFPVGTDDAAFSSLTFNWRSTLKTLVDKNIVQCKLKKTSYSDVKNVSTGPKLNNEQIHIILSIKENLKKYKSHLINGITGSGKTEVYIELAKHTLAKHQQVLVLVPEISLTPQLIKRFSDRIGVSIAVIHSGLNDTQRFNAWKSAADGDVKLIIGTRSAVFTHIPKLGMIIIDEEHDTSYKQQDGFRYNARDLALVRAQHLNIPVILGSATPSLESLGNVERGLFKEYLLTTRAISTSLPQIKLVDIRNQKLTEGISDELLVAMKKHLSNDGQVLLFINRRGFSPVMMCHTCGETIGCKHCDANMTYHKNQHRLWCHHCGSVTRVPDECDFCDGHDLINIGVGTERIENFLNDYFPELHVSRIDRDTTRKKGSLHEKLTDATTGKSRILVGTQLLAKGHDFPNVTLVGILDTDQGLYSADFRASERMSQLITQVSGRAGRAEKPGEVLIQTHHVDHPLLQKLLHEGYTGFSNAALKERKEVGFPPYSYLALLRCESVNKLAGKVFLNEAHSTLLSKLNTSAIDIFGPMTAPMERRAGRYRSQLMLQTKNRTELHSLLNIWIPSLQELNSSKKVRWSMDVDPYDTY